MLFFFSCTPAVIWNFTSLCRIIVHQNPDSLLKHKKKYVNDFFLFYLFLVDFILFSLFIFIILFLSFSFPPSHSTSVSLALFIQRTVVVRFKCISWIAPFFGALVNRFWFFFLAFCVFFSLFFLFWSYCGLHLEDSVWLVFHSQNALLFVFVSCSVRFRIYAFIALLLNI